MALHGVETGSMNPRLAAMVAPRAGSSGPSRAARATEITTGTTMLADAVLDVVYEAPLDRKQSCHSPAQCLGQPGLKREHAERKASSVEQHHAPVDLDRLPPGDRRPLIAGGSGGRH